MKPRLYISALLFALCVGPSFISYRPYFFRWDDSSYLRQSVAVNRAFWSGALWSGKLHGIGVVSARPPAMAFLGLPWGQFTSWEASGKCFVTLISTISILAALCFYFMLRIGIKPLFLLAAAASVFMSLGPYPPDQTAQQNSPHYIATSFLADSLLAWTTLAAVLLIPYEAETENRSLRHAGARGLLWAFILCLGLMTKISFAYFVALVLPLLLLIRLYYSGVRSAAVSFLSFCLWAAPSALYLVLWGRLAWENAKGSSFGTVAEYYYAPMREFLYRNAREAPGLVLSSGIIITAIAYLCVKRPTVRMPDLLSFVIVVGFGLIVLAAPNRELRFAFPAIVALPFLAALLISSARQPVPRRPALFAASLVFCVLALAGVPTLHRAKSESLMRSEVVLAQAFACDARRVVLATDSPTLNRELVNLSLEISAPVTAIERNRIQVSTLANNAMSGTSIDQDEQDMLEGDLLIFQDERQLFPAFTNVRVSKYKAFAEQSGLPSIRVGEDMSVYFVRCRPRE